MDTKVFRHLLKNLRWVVLWVGFLLLSVTNLSAQDAESYTPSHVFERAEQIILEIQIIRQAKGVTLEPRAPGVQFNKLPLHVFGKTIEILEKVARIQEAHGLVPVELVPIPIKKIVPREVYDNGTLILEELRKVKKHLGIETTIVETLLPEGKTPSDVYEHMWRASYLLDGLVGPLTPNHVFQNTQHVQNEISMVAQALGVSLKKTPVPQTKRKLNPKDVLIEMYSSLYRIALLERKIGIPELRPPLFPTGTIIPSDPYDATNMLLAELVRIKLHLGVRTLREQSPMPQGKTPANVYTQSVIIGKQLEQLL